MLWIILLGQVNIVSTGSIVVSQRVTSVVFHVLAEAQVNRDPRGVTRQKPLIIPCKHNNLITKKVLRLSKGQSII